MTTPFVLSNRKNNLIHKSAKNDILSYRWRKNNIFKK